MTSAAAARPVGTGRPSGTQSTVKELLDWLAPRLTSEQQKAMNSAQSNYRVRTLENPNAARTELITQIQVICGDDNIKRFHAFRAQANRVASPMSLSTPNGASSSIQQLAQPQHSQPLQGGPATAVRPTGIVTGGTSQVPGVRPQPVSGLSAGMSPVAAAQLLQQQRQRQQLQARAQQQQQQPGGRTASPAVQPVTGPVQPSQQQQQQQQGGDPQQQTRGLQQQARGPQNPPKPSAAAPDRDDNFADVLTGTGINEDAEQAALTSIAGAATISGAAAAIVPPPPLLFSQEALHHQLAAVAARNCVKAADPGCHPLMAEALKSHLVTVLTRAVAAARHRCEGSRGARPQWAPPDQPPTRDLRREVLAVERRAKEAADARARKEREELLAKASRAKQVDEETQQKVQKAKQDEFERLQQLAANRAAASAMGASKKWSKWGGTSATAATDKPAATPTDSSDAKKGGTKGKRPRDDEDSGTPPSKRAATATTAVTAAPASASTSVLPAVAKPSGETPQPVSTGAAAGRPLQNANRLPRQDDDVITVDLRDLTFVLERDPHYARSTLLYEIMESQP